MKTGVPVGALSGRGIRHRVMRTREEYGIGLHHHYLLCDEQNVYDQRMTRDMTLPVTCLRCIVKGGA